MVTAVVYDCEGPHLNNEERAFFKDADPWGFILFARHCESPEQMRRLCTDLREAVGRNAPIMIDQEGGRVARMRSTQNSAWQDHPPMGVFGELWRLDPERARNATWLNAYLLGQMIAECGVSVDCIPMLDVRQMDSDPVTLGDRALAAHPDIVSALGHAVFSGLSAGGALPIIKHLPGLGRAQCDSHYALPTVSTQMNDLEEIDFKPFQTLSADPINAPMGMTAHIVYEALDPAQCATYSPTIIQEIIREKIGFDGLLFTDDIKMEALGDPYPERARKSLAAGCDIALACNFSLEQKQDIASAIPKLTGLAARRAERAQSWGDRSSFPAPDIERSPQSLRWLIKSVWPPAMA